MRCTILQQDALEIMKKLVGSDLSYQQRYLKRKIFTPEMKRACIEEFAKHFFGTQLVLEC
jgi:hypothetical protein